jgi:hypothetical protein
MRALLKTHKQALLAAVFALLIGPAPRAAQGPGAPAKRLDPKALTVAIADESLSINGKKFALPLAREELVRLLGKPTREARLANTILTWDELGVYAYQRPGTDKVHSFCVALGAEPYDFRPKKLFAGKASVDGAEVRADTAVKAVNAAKRGAPFKKVDLLPFLWVIERPNTIVFLHTAKASESALTELIIEHAGK